MGGPPHSGAVASGAGGGQDGTAGASRPGIQGFEGQGGLAEGAERTGHGSPDVRQKERARAKSSWASTLDTAQRCPLLTVPATGTRSTLRGQLYWTVPSASCELTRFILTTTLRSSYNSGTKSQGVSLRGPRSQSRAVREPRFVPHFMAELLLATTSRKGGLGQGLCVHGAFVQGKMSTKLEENLEPAGPSDSPICPLEGPEAGLRLGRPGLLPSTPTSQLEPPAQGLGREEKRAACGSRHTPAISL